MRSKQQWRYIQTEPVSLGFHDPTNARKSHGSNGVYLGRRCMLVRHFVIVRL